MLAAVNSDVMATGPVDNWLDEPNKAPITVGIRAAYRP